MSAILHKNCVPLDMYITCNSLTEKTPHASTHTENISSTRPWVIIEIIQFESMPFNTDTYEKVKQKQTV